MSLNSSLGLGRSKILSCHVKVTLNLIKSVEANIITGLGLDAPPPSRSQKTNLQKTTGDIYQTTTEQLTTYAMSKAVQLQVQGQWTRWLNYIQQDFSWATLMAMPPNLTLFCLASTFDTLPSPTNLKRWRITAEAKYTLCCKDVCTTAHILGACKISLQQGRYMFRHDTVLHKIIESLKSFILNIKQAVPISPKPFIKFVKKGTKVPNKRTPPVGILRQASDWVFLADIDSNYRFPIHIAFTRLRPDITIFSNVLRKVILIELTCPCEENMESWHSTKINKYLALKVTIGSNGWSVELFSVEVGARGYCSKYVLCCLKKLGFNNTLMRNNIKNFSGSSLECSFCICLARNNKEWASTTNLKVKDSLKESCNSPSPMPYPKQKIKPASRANSIRPIGFISKGNTCYANSILQVLSVMPTLWNRVPSKSNHLFPMLQAISLNMAVKKNSTKPIDPSNFFWALKRSLSSTRVTPFDFNSQQDVAEIL